MTDDSVTVAEGTTTRGGADEDSATSVGTATQLVVSEIFGPTIQGEGPSAGHLAVFLRLGRCNLHCTWCDTSYTWDWKGLNGTKFDPAQELHRISVTDAADALITHGFGAHRVLVVSGGEPLLQQRRLVELLRYLNWRHELKPFSVEIETAGTIMPSVELTNLVNWWNVSPKLEHSGNTKKERYHPEVLGHFADAYNSTFKFVIHDSADLSEVEDMVRGLVIPRHKVWLMPEGVSEDIVWARGKWLAPLAIEHGFNFSTRLHVLVWGNKRGV